MPTDGELERLLGPDGNGWRERKREIFYRLDEFDRGLRRCNDRLERFQEDEVAKLKIDIAMLKVRSGAWGALGGLIGGVTVALAILKLLGHNV